MTILHCARLFCDVWAKALSAQLRHSAPQAKVDEAYQDKARWTRMSINSVAGCGMFSSDRTIAEYARDIWHVEPCIVPAP